MEIFLLIGFDTMLPGSKMDGSTTVTSDRDEKASLFSVPATAFRFHLCPYLTAFDLLRLRETSKRCHDMLHREEGKFSVRTFEMWKTITSYVQRSNVSAHLDVLPYHF